MILKELKEWVNTIPEEHLDYDVASGEVSELNGKTFYKVEKLIISMLIDKENEVFILLSQSETPITEEDINNINNENEHTD